MTFHFVCSICFLPLKPNPSAIASVCCGSCVQEKPSAFHPTSLCRNSTDVRKPGPMRSQIFTFNTSRINCSRSSALSSGMPKMKSSHQCTPSASSIAAQYKQGTTAFSLKAMIAESFLHGHRNVKHSDDHRRVCTLGLIARCLARISRVGLPQTCQISTRPCSLPWPTIDIFEFIKLSHLFGSSLSHFF